MRVDVLMSGIPPGGNPGEGSRVNTLLQNIQVLSAGENLQKDSEGKPHPVQVVNLLVTPEQAEKLTLASSQTRIQLVLRNPLDTQTTNPPGTRMSELFGTSGARPPLAPGPALGGKPRTVRGRGRYVSAASPRLRGPWTSLHPRSGSSRCSTALPRRKSHSQSGRIQSESETDLERGLSELGLAARAAPFALPVAWLLTLLFMTAGAQEHQRKGSRPGGAGGPSLPANTAVAGPDRGQIHAARQHPPDGARFGRPGRLRRSNGRRPQRSAGERQSSGRDHR